MQNPLIWAILSGTLLAAYVCYAGHRGLKYISANVYEQKKYKHEYLYLAGRLIIIVLLYSAFIFSISLHRNYNSYLVNEKRIALEKEYKPIKAKITENNNQLRWYKTERQVYTIKGNLKKLKEINQHIQDLTNDNHRYNNKLGQLDNEFFDYANDYGQGEKYFDKDLSDF